MNWVLMIATLTYLSTGPQPSYSWKAYSVQDAQGCRDLLAKLRGADTWHANCHDQAHSIVTPLVAYGKDVP